MITRKQILGVEGDEFSKLAGEVLAPDERHHMYPLSDTNDCPKCHQDTYEESGRGTLILQQPCPVIDSILLTAANAYKWRNWAVEKFGVFEFCRALKIVYSLEKPKSAWEFDYWGIAIVQNIHHIKAACLCALGEEK